MIKVQAYQLSEQQIVEHFATMEKKFKRHTGEPFFPSLNYTLDLIESGDKLKSLKTEIDNMVFFVGLGTMPVKLGKSKLSNAVAIINMANTDCIDITINENEIDANHLDSIMATIAHELSHKVLFMNNIWFTDKLAFENEIYADLATFYLGFGKFTMIDYLRKDGGQTGYLTPDTYAMAYVLSEYMNGRRPSTDGLPEHAAKEVETAIQKCSMSWLARIGGKDAAKEMWKTASLPLGRSELLLNLLERVVENGRAQVKETSKVLSEFYFGDGETPIAYRIAQMAVKAKELGYNPNRSVGNALVDSLMESLLPLMEADMLGLKGMLLQADASKMSQHCPVCDNVITMKEDWKGRAVPIYCKNCKTYITLDYNLNSVYYQLEQLRRAQESKSQAPEQAAPVQHELRRQTDEPETQAPKEEAPRKKKRLSRFFKFDEWI